LKFKEETTKVFEGLSIGFRVMEPEEYLDEDDNGNDSSIEEASTTYTMYDAMTQATETHSEHSREASTTETKGQRAYIGLTSTGRVW
jgi:hypothetical protein